MKRTPREMPRDDKYALRACNFSILTMEANAISPGELRFDGHYEIALLPVAS